MNDLLDTYCRFLASLEQISLRKIRNSLSEISSFSYMICFCSSVSFFGSGSGASGSVSKTSTLLFLIRGCLIL